MQLSLTVLLLLGGTVLLRGHEQPVPGIVQSWSKTTVPSLEDSLLTHETGRMWKDVEGCGQMKEHEEIVRQLESSV